MIFFAFFDDVSFDEVTPSQMWDVSNKVMEAKEANIKVFFWKRKKRLLEKSKQTFPVKWRLCIGYREIRPGLKWIQETNY